MFYQFNRLHRIEKELMKKITFILQFYIDDCRINKIFTISEVKVSKDLNIAKVFISFLGENSSKKIKEYIKILQSTSKYIRKLLSKSIFLRKTPLILFFYDNSLQTGIKMNKIINNLIQVKKKK
ncbi:30S ribosome-binding factor RbfA [Buchnera aphidicola]|uniref:30S ribosome-binding factor RbfA n=1 Tax=Buchnera aphidicola TaxID=9 RepID=UPI0034639976